MIDRRSLFGAFTKMVAILPSVAGRASQAPAAQPSGRRSIQKKVDEVASLADQLEIEDFDDVSFAARLAFERANTKGGRGTSFRVPPRVMVMKTPLRVPDRIMLVGSGMRDTIFQAKHDGPMFIFDGVEHAGLSNVRLGLGTRSRTQGIQIETNDRSALRLSFSDIEIAGGGRAAKGQIGVSITARGKHIVSECTFDRLILSEIDRPVVERGPEGNEWTRFVIDQFGYLGGAAFDSVANANHYQGRIAGIPGLGGTGFRQGGFRNMLLLRIDIGNDASALDLAPNTRNIVILQRPAEVGPPPVQTPLGRVVGNTVIDGDETTLR
jgi:hypothetical protein